jgi:hypothetical protein
MMMSCSMMFIRSQYDLDHAKYFMFDGVSATIVPYIYTTLKLQVSNQYTSNPGSTNIGISK